ncbi:hypothetical protein HY837_02775 [archaeon]|nr:hypothetical protein [archaeon]
MTSIATNPFVYGAIAYAAFRSAGMNFMDAGLLAGVGIAMPFGLTESCVRIQCGGSSLPGKIVSVPLEILTDEEVSK